MLGTGIALFGGAPNPLCRRGIVLRNPSPFAVHDAEQGLGIGITLFS